MFDDYLKFYLTNYSDILPNNNTVGFHISIDDNGVKLIGGITEDTPQPVVDVYNIIIGKLKKLNDISEGKGPAVLTDKDLDQIISTAFTEGLGEPDEVGYSTGEDNEELVTYIWDFGDGELRRTITKPKKEDEIERMDENSVEYFNAKLTQAISNEDYEMAAHYRDKINNFS